jgi:predicted CXXCH cytochrome family protein
VAWARATRGGEAREPGGAGGAAGLVVDFKANDSRYQVDACAPCHARRGRLRGGEHPGQPFLDTFRPALLQPTLYYPDGQQLDEVYEYGSFLQSKMYQRGVRCSDCHDPHSLKLKAQGNGVCLQCHRAQPDPRFPGLAAKDYEAPAHHFHRAGSAGAQCVGCHMPAKHYMVVDPRRDHSFRIPRPDLSVKLGTPNACTACHMGQSAQWAAAAVQRWYGPARQGPHYGEVIAAGREGHRGAVPPLMALAGDGRQPAIVRATALELLRGYGAAGAAAMVTATKDPDPLVRAAAAGGLGPLAPRERLAAAPLLKDPIRLVRIEAARVLASAPSEALDPSQRRTYEAALAEYQDAQMAMADMPSSHLNLGVLYADQGRVELAEQAYRTALRMDPYFLPARSNLAQLYNQMRRNADAERVLREGIARHPQSGELFYSLGLVLAEEKRVPEAAAALGKAAALLPGRARVRYNYGLALQQLGRRPEAEAALRQASQLDPRDPQIVHALAIFYVQQRDWRRALPYAQKLAELAPGDSRARELLQQIQQASAAGQGPR